MDIKENTTWKNKNSSGSVVVNKVIDGRKHFNGVRVYFNFDNGCGVQIEDSMLIADFEQEYELLKQRYFYIAYTAILKGGKSRKNNSFCITEDGSHFNSIKFISNVMRHEKATRVVIDNFIELSEKDFKDFQRGVDYECTGQY